MQRPLRLLNIIRSVDTVHGGPAEGVRQLVRGIRAGGHESAVITLDAPGSDCLLDFPTTLHALGPAYGNWGYTPRLVPWLRMHAPRFDGVIAHGLWQYQTFGAWRALRGTGTPLFVMPHGMLDPWFSRAYPSKHTKKQLYWQLAESRVLRDAQAVLFTTQTESLLARGTFKPYRAHHEVIGYGLELSAEARSATAEDFLSQHPALRGKRLVLFLARLHPKKGCDLLVDAFAQVAARDAALHLVMAGPDSDGLEARLITQVRKLGLEGRVTFTGMLRGAAKWGALRASEVFVLPSHQENFGVAVAEALAMGTPALVSNQVNIWREVVDGGAGMAEPDTAAGTLALLQSWLDLGTPERQAMRDATVPCFEAHFQVRGATERLLALVNRAAKARADGRPSAPLPAA
jgi:glycosyltransferase involved in cell wall biosynthesis